MNIRNALVVALGMMLTIAGPGLATQRFFRVVSTQDTVIVACAPGSVTWANTVVPAACRVEWTPDIRGLWLTNHLDGPVLANGHLHRVAIPQVLASGEASTVRRSKGSLGLTHISDGSGIDMDGDGTADVELRVNDVTDIWLLDYDIGDRSLQGIPDTPITAGH